MRKFVILASVAGAVAALPGAGAVANEANCGRDVHTVGPYHFTYNDGEPDYHWLYEESNGTAGLQAGGAQTGATGLSASDDCQEGAANPDHLIY